LISVPFARNHVCEFHPYVGFVKFGVPHDVHTRLAGLVAVAMSRQSVPSFELGSIAKVEPKLENTTLSLLLDAEQVANSIALEPVLLTLPALTQKPF
jgi:hypothetical protein